MTPKIAVVSEGRADVWLADADSLKAWITAQGWEKIHNMIPTGPMVLGADHDVADVLTDIDRADRIGILTGDAQRGNMAHALSLITGDRMEMYDIGPVTEDDLEVSS
jgi:hypothetical protein